MINQSAIEAQAKKLKLITGKEIQAVYNEHSGVQYFPASMRVVDGFGLLYVTKDDNDENIKISKI